MCCRRVGVPLPPDGRQDVAAIADSRGCRYHAAGNTARGMDMKELKYSCRRAYGPEYDASYEKRGQDDPFPRSMDGKQKHGEFLRLLATRLMTSGLDQHGFVLGSSAAMTLVMTRAR